MQSIDRSNIVEDYINAHRSFFHSLTAPEGSEGTTAGRVVASCSITVHHGYRSNEVKRAKKKL